jgi:hypothetical protein
MSECVLADCYRPRDRANYCLAHYQQYVLGDDGQEGPP